MCLMLLFCVCFLHDIATMCFVCSLQSITEYVSLDACATYTEIKILLMFHLWCVFCGVLTAFDADETRFHTFDGIVSSTEHEVSQPADISNALDSNLYTASGATESKSDDLLSAAELNLLQVGATISSRSQIARLHRLRAAQKQRSLVAQSFASARSQEARRKIRTGKSISAVRLASSLAESNTSTYILLYASAIAVIICIITTLTISYLTVHTKPRVTSHKDAAVADASVFTANETPQAHHNDDRELEAERKSTFALLFWGCAYMCASSALTFMNKYLMTKDRFPYATLLIALQQGAISIFSLVLYLLASDMYPSMELVKQKKLLTCKLIVPLAACCSGSFVFGQDALIYVSVALTQIMKEGNIVCVHALSLVCGMEVWNSKVAIVLLAITILAILTVSGDINFIWYGVALQLASQLCDCARTLFIQLTMSSRPGAVFPRLDPMTGVGLTAPAMFIMLSMICVVSWESVWSDKFFEWKWVLLLNCLIAFGLNLIVFKLIQVSSGIHSVLVGTAKGILIVLGSSFIFAEPLTLPQYVCFFAILFLIYLHAFMTFHPKPFEKGWSAGIYAAFGRGELQSE